MWAFITTIRCLIKLFMLGIYADSYFVLIQNNNHHNNTNNNNYNININVNTDVPLKNSMQVFALPAPCHSIMLT